MISSTIYLVLIIVATGLSQTLLKIGANYSLRKKFITAYANSYTIIVYILYSLTTIFTVYALKEIQLNLLYAATSFKFILMLILSKLLLNEKIDNRKIVAVGCIVLGIRIFNV